MGATHKVAPHQEWMTARQALLAKEKEFTRLRDDLSRLRRELPWKIVTGSYFFDGPNGKESLSDLFAGRSQLIVYHFMFGPEWSAGCSHCSFWADNFDRIITHLNQRDVTMVAISRAPYSKLASYRKRLGWSFKWVSAGGTSFNFDYQASFRPDDLAKGEAYYNYATRKTSLSELPGISVFCKDASDTVFHTYSCYSRGLDMMNAAYHYLDLVPKGRDEGGRGSADGRR